MACQKMILLFRFVIFALICHEIKSHSSGGYSPKPSRPKPAPSHYEKKTVSCPDCKCSCEVKPIKEEKKECRWKTLFKQASGKGQNVFDEWRTEASINEGDAVAQDIATEKPLRCGSVIDNWNKNIIDKVKVELYEDGVRRAFFVFDGIGSDKMSWFSRDRLISSSYDDIKTYDSQFFRIKGDDNRERHFLIAKYLRCDRDCGYLVIADPDNTECDWEKVTPKPFFLYGKLGTCSTFDNDDEIGFADRFVISARLCDLGW